jgi:hypothetical protein
MRLYLGEELRSCYCSVSLSDSHGSLESLLRCLLVCCLCGFELLLRSLCCCWLQAYRRTLLLLADCSHQQTGLSQLAAHVDQCTSTNLC